VIHLFLFDIDSVLVEAQGYLAALQATVAHFSRQMGVGEHQPTEEEVRIFEANGLTSEWDSGATCVAALLLERMRREPPHPLPPSWPEAFFTLAAHPLSLPHPDYIALAKKIGQRVEQNLSPAQAAKAVLGEEVQAMPGPKDSGSAVVALLEALLGHTHDFYRAPLTRHFQHLALGSQGVAKTYGVVPDFESLSYLEEYDQPVLAPATRALLLESIANGKAGAALYTTRPSLPPLEVEESPLGYPPEAEMAQGLLGLEAWPLIGLGRMLWLARKTGEELQNLVKPSPVQALAAIGAAWSGQEVAALEAAFSLHRDNQLRLPLSDLKPTTVHVFEDTVGGIEATECAVKALNTAGVTIACRPYGIAPADNPKAETLATRGVPTYPSVNQAILDGLRLI
jgi:hypothetical protein